MGAREVAVNLITAHRRPGFTMNLTETPSADSTAFDTSPNVAATG
jgi:hypothetical protein